MTPLSRLFDPRAVAVVGASSDPAKLGSVMAATLAAGDRPVAGVNARNPAPERGLHPTVAAAGAALGRPIDLVVSCVPAAATAGVVADAAAAGAGAVLVCAGGFAEAGGPGERHQRELEEAVARTRVRLLGPNTSGFFVPAAGLVASFVPGAARVAAGGVAVVASSGGVNHALAFGLHERGLGVRVGVGLGAGVDVTAADVLEYLADDPELTAVALHVESVRDGRRLADAVRRLVPRVPVVALVVGRGDVGDFAASHTGALATSWRTARAALRQAGAVMVDDDRAMLDALAVLARRRLPASPRPGLGIVTAQAGPGLLLADAVRAAGVDVPTLSAPTRAALSQHLPPMTYQGNPVDTGRPTTSFGEVVRTVAADERIDGVAVYALLEPDAFDLAATLSDLPDGLPLAVGTTGAPTDVSGFLAADDHDLPPVFRTSAALATALRAWDADSRGRAELETGTAPAVVPPLELPSRLDEDTAKTLLEGLGVRVPRRRVCVDLAEARTALEQFGTVAVKLLDPAVIHKTEVGGVHLGIDAPARLEQVYAALCERGAERVLVEEFAPDGAELLVGVRRDAVFGPVVVLGLGGVVAEALEQVSVRLAPLTATEAARMLDELPGARLLDGWRGGPVLRRDRLVEVLVVLAGAVAATPAVSDLEINPLRVLPDGDVMALDAVVLRREVPPASTVVSDARPAAP
ncbi:acetate--CoA ligase family protein [Egicoccus sp. AB-alg2]|uniref:acetate--CoA ligase family protein n=1 Tax=Egicoccus sp. AB-alg2 TaxID=3242693 RepID=UPI00359D7C49